MAGSGAPVRLATRGSRQALTQAGLVAAQITQRSGVDVELVVVDTTGDVRAEAPLHEIGGLGVFVKEVQQAVLDGRADLAVHSAKDLPSTSHPQLVLAAFCARRDPADVLVGARLAALARGATVATGSVRRRALLHERRPDLHFAELRGNIATRLERVPAGGAIVMAAAALEILELTDRVAERLEPDRFVPAVGQGCVAVETRIGDTATIEAVATVDDYATRRAVEVERAFLGELGTGCAMPVGAFAVDGVLRSFLASHDPLEPKGRLRTAWTVTELGHDHELNMERAKAAARESAAEIAAR